MFSGVMRQELSKWGIKVAAIQPSGFRTGWCLTFWMVYALSLFLNSRILKQSLEWFSNSFLFLMLTMEIKIFFLIECCSFPGHLLALDVTIHDSWDFLSAPCPAPLLLCTLPNPPLSPPLLWTFSVESVHVRLVSCHTHCLCPPSSKVGVTQVPVPWMCLAATRGRWSPSAAYSKPWLLQRPFLCQQKANRDLFHKTSLPWMFPHLAPAGPWWKWGGGGNFDFLFNQAQYKPHPSWSFLLK